MPSARSRGASRLAELMGIPRLVIGFTVVTFGTASPELTVSHDSALSGQGDIALGNVVGSSIFNILGVLGVVGAVAPHGIPVPESALRFDIPVLIATAVVCLPVFWTDSVIPRWEGLLFLCYCIAYKLYLILDSSGHDALPAFNSVMTAAVISLTVATLLTFTVRPVRNRGKKPS